MTFIRSKVYFRDIFLGDHLLELIIQGAKVWEGGTGGGGNERPLDFRSPEFFAVEPGTRRLRLLGALRTKMFLLAKWSPRVPYCWHGALKPQTPGYTLLDGIARFNLC